MNNFGTLYLFELKKILKSRLTIAMVVITVIVVMIEALAPGWSINREMRDARKVLEGRVIDDNLLNEMYPKIDTYGEVWNGDNYKYFGIAYIVQCIADSNTPLKNYSAEDIYNKRDEYIYAAMKHNGLTHRELKWWEDIKDRVKTPFTYHYNGGGIYLAQGMAGILVCIMLMAALCLSTVFTMEHRQRTDQMILSCKNGRNSTYFAKIAAGISVVFGLSIIAAGILTVLVLAIYGREGLQAAVQLELPMSAYPLTMGQFILIQLIIMLTAGILFAVFAMAVSELLKNSLAVTGIIVGLFIIGQIDILPTKYRVLSQASTLLPTNLISIWSLMEYRLVGFGGHLFTEYAASPIMYLVVSIIIVIVGGIAYNRFQVTGR